jgi:hypothetical protein
MEAFPAIEDLMADLGTPHLHRIFEEWISCLHLVVESGAEYIQA